MKKIVGIIVAFTMLFTMASALEFGQGTGYDETTGRVVAVYTGYSYNQATMLAYDVTNVEGATVDTAFVDTTTTPIVGIDQKTADGSFSFPIADDFSGKIVLMIGGTDETPIKMLLSINEGNVEKIVFVCGDVNGDGVANGVDASYIMGSTTGGGVSYGDYDIGAEIADSVKCGDVNDDSVANGVDASYIMGSTTGGGTSYGTYEINETVTLTVTK